MPTPSVTATKQSFGSRTPRSAIERSIVWGLILVLLILGGIEVYAQQSWQRGYNALQEKLEKLEKGKNASASLTSDEVRKLLGKEPEFSGNPGQIQTNSQYYEAYVWRSLLKRQFVAPPTNPEIVDMNAMFSGSVPPEKIKYRTPGLDKNLATPDSFFSAYTIYVYYGIRGKNGIREVVNVLQRREPYMDAVLKLPDAEELRKRHDTMVEIGIGNASKYRKTPLTQEEKDRMDPWKYPPGAPDSASPAIQAPSQSDHSRKESKKLQDTKTLYVEKPEKSSEKGSD